MKKVAELIDDYLKENGIKQEYLVNKTNFTSSTLSSTLSRQRKLTADEFIDIVIALDLDPNYFINTIIKFKEKE